jgi:predicted acylesterase/phospholipase RssA
VAKIIRSTDVLIFLLDRKLVSVYIRLNMQPFRVLSIDGGGIRGLYSATLIEELALRFARTRGAPALDVGKGFDLIAGTSTGGIIACALAYGSSPKRVAKLYREAGPRIFAGNRLPEGNGWLGKLRFVRWAISHLNRPIHDSRPLRDELAKIFGSATLGSVYQHRKVALCIPSVSLLRETPRVFKTAHLSSEHFRDDDIPLVEACLATAAAPVFLPLARVAERTSAEPDVYADGGLWMNNPTIVALLEALTMTPTEQEIQIISVGTCPAPAGGNPAAIPLQRGLAGWKVGSKALELSMNAQAAAAHELVGRMVTQFGKLGRRISYVRCAETKPSSEQAKDLALDNASNDALGLLARFGAQDAIATYKWVQDNSPQGAVIRAIFDSMPAVPASE